MYGSGEHNRALVVFLTCILGRYGACKHLGCSEHAASGHLRRFASALIFAEDIGHGPLCVPIYWLIRPDVLADIDALGC